MKQFLVTLKLPVLAEDEQCAREYGNNLASKAPETIASGVEDTGDEPEIVVEDAE